MDELFPHDWYWLADDGDIYSSARQCVVKADDQQYQDWTADRVATRWPEDDDGQQTKTALLSVIAPYVLLIGDSPLDISRRRRIADLAELCAATIAGGFLSSALGDAHTYPSGATDQLNLMGSVTDSLMPGLTADWETPFWVCDSDGHWSFKAHSAEQIQKAGQDGKAHIINCQRKLSVLTEKVMSAKSENGVAAIVW